MVRSPTSDSAGSGDFPRNEGHVFISYAAEDRDRAHQLAEYLESRGWSVWWDRKIPVGRAFDQVIEEALQQARCVVVLWTKDALASRWVRSEASDAAQRQILVPVLVDDVTMPLEFRLIQALDLRGWKAGTDAHALESVHDAVARIAGAASDTGATHQEAGTVHFGKRYIRLSPAVIAGAALLLGVAAVGVWYWDAFHRETREYYANVTRRWGLPEGIGRLTAEQVFRRNASVALVRRGRRMPADEVRLVNSEGLTPPVGFGLPIGSVAELNPLPAAGADGPVSSELIQLTRVTFSRDASGRLLEQAGFNRGGRRLYTMHFSAPDVAEFKWQGFGVNIRESGIRYLRFSRVASGPNVGLDERVQYFDDQQRPQPDVDGEYGYRLVLSAKGLVTEWVNLGPEGADKANNYGVLKEVRSYDPSGNMFEATTVDAQGSPKASRVGPATNRIEYDQSGNQTRLSFFNEMGQPVVAEIVRAASIGFEYDRRGHVTSQTFFGPDQKMVVGQLGFAKQTIEWQTSRRFLARFFGANGRPIPATGGAFGSLITLDANGYPIETSYLNEQGIATRAADGCATARVQYDDGGNVTSFKCLNEQRAPAISIEGFSSAAFTYDAFGNRLTSAFSDLRGAPRLLGETYASIRRTFTPSGHLQKETYLNAQGTPVRNRQGFATQVNTFDTSGNNVATVLLDERDRRVNAVDGYSAIHRKFDGRRLEIETAFLDAGDRPVQAPDGYATVRYEFDQRGFLTRIVQTGPDGKPTRGFYGYCSARIKRNEAGARLEMSFFDENGVPTVAARLGSAKRRWTYDEAGRVAERSDHDANGLPVINAYGYSVLRFRYDDHGREAGRELLDTAGNKLEFKVSVDRLERGSVASEVGLMIGDIILTYDGQTVSTSEQFTNAFERFRSDRARELRIKRAQHILSIDVPPGRLQGLELAERVLVNDTSARRQHGS